MASWAHFVVGCTRKENSKNDQARQLDVFIKIET